MQLCKYNTSYVNRLFLYQLSCNIYCLLPCQACLLNILFNILRYINSFAKQSKKIDQEELGVYLHLDLLKNTIGTQCVTCLFPTKRLKGIQVVLLVQAHKLLYKPTTMI